MTKYNSHSGDFFFFLLIVVIFFLRNEISLGQKDLWPEINYTTKPWTRWWWHGSAVTKDDLKFNMEELSKAGFGGVEITAIYGVKGYEDYDIKFLTPEWIDILKYTLNEAKELGLGVDVANASGWPFGGPWISEEDACKNIQYKIYSLKGGEKLKEEIEFIQEPLVRAVGRKVDISEIKFPINANPNLQELALDQVRFERKLPLIALIAYNSNGAMLDITNRVDKSGKLLWTAPEGNWEIYALFQGWHGKMVERASRGGEGNVIDHFSEKALKHFLEQFDKNAKGKNLDGIRAFFNDSYEVDDAIGEANWTPLMFEEFKSLRGYDLKNYLPALFGKDSDEMNSRVLTDFRETVSDLLLKRFTKVWQKWSRNYNSVVRNQAHGSPANVLDLYAASDIPETEGTLPLRIKLATSAGHLSGKQLISAEAATWLNEHFLSTLSDVKKNFDRYFANGVNHLVYHGTPYSPQSEDWPGRLFYASVHFAPTNTWWDDLKAVNSYVANCQAFLQSSRPDNDILLYFPIYDIWSKQDGNLLKHLGTNNDELTEDLKRLSNLFLNEGYQFDFVSDNLLRMLSVKNGKIVSANFAEYRVLIIPETIFLPLNTFKKIIELTKAGATVVFSKNLPADVPGLHNLAERRKRFEKLKSNIKFEKADQCLLSKLGRGRLIIAENIQEVLNDINIKPENLLKEGLWFNRVKRKEGLCYFISNWSDNEFDKWVRIRRSGSDALWFNPMERKFGKAKVKVVNNEFADVYLKLDKGESIILQWYSNSQNVDEYKFYRATKDTVELNGEWKVTFVKGVPTLPDSMSTHTLDTWTKFSDELKWFSGTAKYTITFAKPDFATDAIQLDLGKVFQSAVVFLNGHKLSTLVGPQYRVVIDLEKLREINTLEILVTNLMANRIIYMDRNKINYKKFYNINFAAHERENMDENGLFTAQNWEPLDSGLVGPVKLIGLVAE
ncbi:glycosyl hydrolase [Melioribacter sp. OK-6-Me]|uniref:glycosyl hydrolase n=1 Tax=unclassified Melioribacter TaxID=2627329 RepID=UPI003EDAFB7B